MDKKGKINKKDKKKFQNVYKMEGEKGKRLETKSQNKSKTLFEK